MFLSFGKLIDLPDFLRGKNKRQIVRIIFESEENAPGVIGICSL